MSALEKEFGQWLTAARDGSRDALGQALESCRLCLLRVAQQELNRDLLAKGGASDLVQETFLEAQQTFARFQGQSEEEMRSWLRRLLHHRAAKFGRRYRSTQKRRLARETSLGPSDSANPLDEVLHADTPSPSMQLMANEQAQQLRKALERLPEDYRRVITLRYVEQCSFEEIGQRLQRTANAARLLWLRAIERVKQEMREPGS
jgi:RNA polymerase sigma-70 factor (ECF subfamily)